MNRILIVILFCVMIVFLKAQPLKTLKIGDVLPPIQVDILEGDGIKKVPLQQLYKDKNIIIDFWATWCAACIKAIGAADTVLQKFKDNVELIPFTYEDPKTINAFVTKNRILNKLTLRYAVNDTVLMGVAIPFKVLPHEVWIDKQGIIKAISYPDEITAENLTDFIKDGDLAIEEKADEMDFDFTKPLLVDNVNILYRSILAPYKPGISGYAGSFPSSVPHSMNKGINRYIMTNTSALALYYAAFSQNKPNIKYNRIVLQVRDSLAVNPYFNPDIARKYKKTHCYCYELLLPQPVPNERLYNYMLEDLNRFLPYEGSIEKRKRMCWVLVNRKKIKNPCTTGSKPKLSWQGGFINKMTNQTMNVLVDYLNWNMDLPVIDETGYKEAMDLELSIEAILKDGQIMFDTDKVKRSLERYGFELLKEERLTNILLIKDKTEK